MQTRLKKAWLLMPVLGVLLMTALPTHALANPIPTPVPPAASPAPVGGANSQVCTDMRARGQTFFQALQTTGSAALPGQQDGMLTSIYNYIRDIVSQATEALYRGLIQNPNYQYAISGVVTLYVAIFGVMFTIGVVQASFGQVLIRLVKLGIIFAMISPWGGWWFFNTYAVSFFNNGTDEIVRQVIQIAAGGGSILPPSASPFYQLDKMAEFLIHPDTIVSLFGAATSGPFALGVTGLMAIAIMGIVKLLIDALRLYVVTFVGRSLLLALGPIFIVFLLFERTKSLFTAWVNNLVSFMLQPILLFIFLSFMIVMIGSAAKNMLSVDLCFIAKQGGEAGTDSQMARWVFLDSNGSPMLQEFTWQGYMGCITGNAPPTNAGNPKVMTKSDCQNFPIKIVDVLTFLLLVFLASRFAGVIDRIASDLSSTFVSLDPAGKMAELMQQKQSPSGGGESNAPRAGPSR